MKTALISVYHKEDIDTMAALLVQHGWRILSTGGTAAFLRGKGLPVTEVSEITRFPEILDGRVKTLHPLVFGPILARPSAEHLGQLAEVGAAPIDLVVVNFYPFEAALEGDRDPAAMVETIDIGGPSMVRAAAKNHERTAVVVDPADYAPVAETFVRDGELPLERRRELAAKAFAYTAYYDSLIAAHFSGGRPGVTPFFTLGGRRVMNLRYGENPHQQAALYVRPPHSPLGRMEQLQGKELSFNNILDMCMVYELCGDFPEDRPFSVIVKHQNPCGAALADTQEEAFRRALAGDPTSAYGGIVGFNRPLDEAAALAMREIFFEVVIAPDFTPAALELLRKKKNLRLIRMPRDFREPLDLKVVPGGFVVQDRDQRLTAATEFTVRTSRPLGAGESRDAEFGWKIIKYVKSNAIILVRDERLIGVGAGQMSRVDAVELAIRKCTAGTEGAVLVSDAYFPFADSIDVAASHRIQVLVQPGGSIRDEEVVAAAEKNGQTMLFTGVRHFRH